jgi:cell shape-determining protein MreC
MAVAAGLAVVSTFGSGRAADSSLSDIDFEKSELRLTLEKVQGENKRLRDELSEREKKLAELRTNIAAITEEGEVFKTQANKLKLRFEALGLDAGSGNASKLEQRLLDAVSSLGGLAKEKKKLSEALVRLSEAVAVFAKGLPGGSTEARTSLEAELRNARAVLGDSSPNAVEAPAVAASISDGMAIAVKDELSLVVMNLGSKQGVREGMPFQVIRGDKLIARVRVVDVREKIAGAVVQNLYSEKEQIKVGDRLKVDARQ